MVLEMLFFLNQRQVQYVGDLDFSVIAFGLRLRRLHRKLHSKYADPQFPGALASWGRARHHEPAALIKQYRLLWKKPKQTDFGASDDHLKLQLQN